MKSEYCVLYSDRLAKLEPKGPFITSNKENMPDLWARERGLCIGGDMPWDSMESCLQGQNPLDLCFTRRMSRTALMTLLYSELTLPVLCCIILNPILLVSLDLLRISSFI